MSLVGLAWPALSMPALAPAEARVPFAPVAWMGSDGLTHLAYELHVTNIYGDTGALRPQGLQVYGDDIATPLAVFSAAELTTMTRPAPAEHAPVRIEPGKRAVIRVWLNFPAGHPLPRTLRHRIEFATTKSGIELLDGVRVLLNASLPPMIGPPLRGGLWLAHEGPGNANSHTGQPGGGERS